MKKNNIVRQRYNAGRTVSDSSVALMFTLA